MVFHVVSYYLSCMTAKSPQVSVYFPKEHRAEIEVAATAAGQTVAAFIRETVMARLRREDWDSPATAEQIEQWQAKMDSRRASADAVARKLGLTAEPGGHIVTDTWSLAEGKAYLEGKPDPTPFEAAAFDAAKLNAREAVLFAEEAEAAEAAEADPNAFVQDPTNAAILRLLKGEASSPVPDDRPTTFDGTPIAPPVTAVTTQRQGERCYHFDGNDAVTRWHLTDVACPAGTSWAERIGAADMSTTLEGRKL